ncbi:MAG: 5'-nucleotidase, lipoprotein e(P4) family [Bacteroidota bacterium]
MKKYYIFLALIIVAVVAFKDKEPATEVLPDNIMVNGKLFTSLFQQNSAEYKALCFQAYTIARLQVDLAVQKPSSKPRAIITDIDETVLDNSPYAVHQALKGKNYDVTTWAEWTARAEADTLAGALSFFNYAASKGIEVFYISNRDEKERKGTLDNLKHYNFPFADGNHLILKQLTSSKEERRQKITATHDIVLFLGDNLADFSVIYDKKSSEDRLLATQQLSAEFGKKFIVLPNANYGDWESALFKYNYKLSTKQKDSVIINCLKNY